MARTILDSVSLNPGELRCAITVEKVSASGDQWSDATPQWTTIVSTRAKIDELGGFNPKEVLGDGMLSAVSTHLVTVRYTTASAGIVAGNRVNFSGRLFRIQVVQNVQMRNRVIRMFCQDLQANVNN